MNILNFGGSSQRGLDGIIIISLRNNTKSMFWKLSKKLFVFVFKKKSRKPHTFTREYQQSFSLQQILTKKKKEKEMVLSVFLCKAYQRAAV